MISLIRLDKYLADVGVGTRSEVKKLLKQGLVSINDQIVKDSSTKVDPETDKVVYKGQELTYQEFRYYMLNKPAGCISATKDGLSQTVIEFLKGEPTKDLFPVGRLDKDTEGLLLITNDGMLAHNLLSPKKHVDKTYIAYVDKKLDEEQLNLFKKGLDIGDETPTLPAYIKEASKEAIIEHKEKASINDDNFNYSAVYTVILKEGRYHQIKRMFEHLGSKVVYLKRLSMGKLLLDSQLIPGCYRPLTPEEILSLKQ